MIHTNRPKRFYMTKKTKLTEEQTGQATAAMATLLDEMLGQMKSKPREFKDDTSHDTQTILDTSAYNHIEKATDILTDSLSAMKKGRAGIEEAFYLISRAGLSKEDMDNRMDMIHAVDKALCSGINSMVEAHQTMVLEIAKD